MKTLETIPCPDSRDPDLSGLSVGSDGVILIDSDIKIWHNSFVLVEEFYATARWCLPHLLEQGVRTNRTHPC